MEVSGRKEEQRGWHKTKGTEDDRPTKMNRTEDKEVQGLLGKKVQVKVKARLIQRTLSQAFAEIASKIM